MSDHKLWGKPEWQKAKYKQGKLIFKNVLIGSFFPQGISCVVTIKDGNAIAGEKHTLQFGQTLSYQPKNDKLEITITTPGKYGMEPVTMKGDNCRSYGDVNHYICENPNIYKCSVFSLKSQVPIEARPYI